MGVAAVQTIEFEYTDTDGQVWLLRCPRDRLPDAVDAAFRWFLGVPEFSSRHLGVFLAAILQDAVEQSVLTSDSFAVVSRILNEVPSAPIGYDAQVNLMRSIVLAALDSTV